MSTPMTHAIEVLVPDNLLFMKKLDTADRTALFAGARPLVVEAGKRIFDKDDLDATLYVVLAGKVEISITNVNGRRIALNIISEGECFGEIGMLDGKQRTASAVAIEQSKFLTVSRPTFLKIVQERPKIAMAMVEVMCERIRWISSFLEDQALLPLVHRLARRLLLLHDRFADSNGKIEISQADIADFSGATREAVNKILATWRDQGWIALGRMSITVRNEQALVNLVAASQFI